MLKKRKNVFETNSSSVHTITLDGCNNNDLEVSKDGFVHLSLGYYGKNKRRYQNSYSKLSYLLLVTCYTHGIYLCYDSWDDDEQDTDEFTYWRDALSDLMDTEEYKLIEHCVIDEFHNQGIDCKGIKIHASDCGIDHQSTYNLENLEQFLQNNDVQDIHEFIFGKAVLNTDCD